MLDGAGSARVGGVVSGFIFFFARFAPFFLFLALGKIARDDYGVENQFAIHTPLYVFFLQNQITSSELTARTFEEDHAGTQGTHLIRTSDIRAAEAGDL